MTGRPKKIIDWAKVEILCHMQCTQEEICAVIDVCEDTLNLKSKEDNGCCFSAFYKQKRKGGKASLRRSQWLNAIDNKNTTMQIWLGKQYLGQSDKNEIDQTNKNIEINIDKEDLAL